MKKSMRKMRMIIKENNDENINNEEEEGNNKIEQFEEDSLGDD